MVQCSTLSGAVLGSGAVVQLYCAVECSVVQCSAVQCSAVVVPWTVRVVVKCSAVQWSGSCSDVMEQCVQW